MGAMLHTTTLNQNRDFQRAYRRGKSFVHPLLVTYAVKSNRPVARIGLTATKKIGKANRRNRARRIIREAYRQLEPTLPTGYDFVFVARARTSSREVKMDDVKRVMEGHMKKLLRETGVPSRQTSAKGKMQPGREAAPCSKD